MSREKTAALVVRLAIEAPGRARPEILALEPALRDIGRVGDLVELDMAKSAREAFHAIIARFVEQRIAHLRGQIVAIRPMDIVSGPSGPGFLVVCRLNVVAPVLAAASQVSTPDAEQAAVAADAMKQGGLGDGEEDPGVEMAI